jgi:hypothetical protein
LGTRSLAGVTSWLASIAIDSSTIFITETPCGSFVGNCLLPSLAARELIQVTRLSSDPAGRPTPRALANTGIGNGAIYAVVGYT